MDERVIAGVAVAVAALAIALLHPWIAAVAAVAGLVAVIASPGAARIILVVAATVTGLVAAYFLFSVGD